MRNGIYASVTVLRRTDNGLRTNATHTTRAYDVTVRMPAKKMCTGVARRTRRQAKRQVRQQNTAGVVKRRSNRELRAVERDAARNAGIYCPPRRLCCNIAEVAARQREGVHAMRCRQRHQGCRVVTALGGLPNVAESVRLVNRHVRGYHKLSLAQTTTAANGHRA